MRQGIGVFGWSSWMDMIIDVMDDFGWEFENGKSSISITTLYLERRNQNRS
jgi:hypothetical protein